MVPVKVSTGPTQHGCMVITNHHIQMPVLSKPHLDPALLLDKNGAVGHLLHRHRGQHSSWEIHSETIHPCALAWDDSHHAILEEDVDLAHDLVIVKARLDISKQSVPGYILLESRAARRKLIDTGGADGVESPIEGSEVGTHRDGAETMSNLAPPDSSVDLTDLARWAASCTACQTGAFRAVTEFTAV